MAKVTLEITLDFDGFDSLTDAENLSAIEAIIESGADSTCSEINVKSVKIDD